LGKVIKCSLSALCLIIPVNHSTPSLNPSPVKALLALKIKYFRVYKILQINANIPSHIPYMPWFIINLLKLHQIAHLNEIKSQWIGQFMLSDSYHYHITLLVGYLYGGQRISHVHFISKE
jgi:hypothetical protein